MHGCMRQRKEEDKMKIQIDKNGYVENYVIVGESSACDIEVEEPENFDFSNYNAYKLVDDVLVLDAEKAKELASKLQKDELRITRSRDCFSVINRGALWYKKLTDEQKAELEIWYQAWLDVTDTMVIPEKPEWLK